MSDNKKYRDGELLYVCRKNNSWNGGLFVLYRGEYEGKDDLSYHGSPWYENFIICEYLNSRDRVDFGDQTYCWRSASEYIRTLKESLRKIDDIARYV